MGNKKAGKQKKHMKKVVVALPSVGRLTGLDIIKTLRVNLAASGYTPVFYLGMSAKDLKGNEEFKKAVAKMRDVKIAKTHRNGFGAGLMTAINQGIKKESPHLVVTLPDDYEVEARHMHKLLNALERRRAEVAIGVWDKVSWRTFPVPQFLGEINASVLVTYANPTFKPRSQIGATAIDAIAAGKAFQTLTGMFAFTPVGWRKVTRAMNVFTENKALLLHSGIEPAIALSALRARAKIVQPRVPRRFEHNWPRTPEEIARYRLSRAKHFSDSARLVKEFLANTGQRRKLRGFRKYVERVEQRIAQRPIIRTGQRPIERGRVTSTMPAK